MKRVLHGVFIGMLVGTAAGAAELSTGIDEQAQLPYWELQDEGMSLRLVQRMPDQSRGFFRARGFSKVDVEQVAQRCVFQTVFKNRSNTAIPSPLRYNLENWVVQHGQDTSTMMTREIWQTLWSEHTAPQAARIAFKWALYPTQQTYQPGDYNWGMSMMDLTPGSRFDLKVVWHQYGEMRSALIKDMRCAADIAHAPVQP